MVNFIFLIFLCQNVFLLRIDLVKFIKLTVCARIASIFGIPKIVIGATIIALGTSLPELVSGIDSVRKLHADMYQVI